MISILLSPKKQTNNGYAYDSYMPVDVRPAGFFDKQKHSYVLNISDIEYSDEAKRKLCSECYIVENGKIVSTGKRKYRFSDAEFSSLFSSSTHITMTAQSAFSKVTDLHPGSIDRELTTDINNPVLMVLNI